VSTALLSPREAALAGLLHDIGKLAQRAHPDEQALRAAYQDQDLEGLQASILPSRQGRYTHRHALWTDFFFEWAEREHLRWPDGMHRSRLRRTAICHHNPGDPADWIVAQADRLASGLERKKKDEGKELALEAQPHGFREVELHALVPALWRDDALVKQPKLCHAAEELSAAALVPQPPQPTDQPRRFGVLWDAWLAGWEGFASHALSAERFEQSALALSERVLWAIPSSTVDQPDVSLHDHAHAVAAIAAALAAFHGGAGETSEGAIKDRAVPKFRLVAFDLSGIQDALFRLAGSEGAARVLRARSFLMAETMSAVLLAIRERLDLPASSVLIAAGGKAELLAPALPDLDARLGAARETLDAWLIEHWQGDLALNIAAGAPFAAREFEDRGKGLRVVRGKLDARLDTAKHRPFIGWRPSGQRFIGTGVIEAPFQEADGACATCGARPAVVRPAPSSAGRCVVCDSAYRLGQHLPKADGFAVADAAEPAGETDAAQMELRMPLPFGLALLPWSARGSAARRSVVFEGQGEIGTAVPRTTAHVPVIDDPDAPHYRQLRLHEPESGSASAKDDLMTFAHIAAEALEPHPEGGFRGRALLAIVKADVDRLGLTFSRGLGEDQSPARVAQLSRLIDSYFARRLPWLLEREFPATYTVYAGGDDLLLVAPWRSGLPLAVRLREDFRAFAGGNPNLSLSAGIAFVHPHHPIRLAAAEAEAMLDRAKHGGRDRLGLFDRVLSWQQAQATLQLAEELHQAVLNDTLPPTFLHRMRGFAAMRGRVGTTKERAGDLGWASKWGYHRARFLDRAREDARASLAALLDRAVPTPAAPSAADPEIAMTIALWRNR
jgi:CRISPR-associated protein Csm1